ncbi:MAG: hypothetical protein ACOC15_01560 [Desulfovibrionales bacterium]
MSKRVPIVFLLLLSLSLVGCAASKSGKVYTRDQAREKQSVQYGTVLQVEEVLIEGSRSGLGVLGGAIVGGVLGSTIGSGTGKTLAILGGAVAGGAVGGVGEKAATQKDGLEITVELDNGELVSIVQEADRPFAVGDRVRVLTASDGSARVTQ